MQVPVLSNMRASAPWFHVKSYVLAKRSPPHKDVYRATNTIFVHIPKCGGMSVLRDVYGVQEQLGHASVASYYGADAEFFRRAFKFTILRDPISRFVSAFRFLREGGINAQDWAWRAEHVREADINDFVARQSGEDRWSTTLRWKHFRPQSHYVTGTLFGQSLSVDFFGRQDRMQDSLDVVCDRMGIDRVPTKSFNASKTSEGTVLTDKTREIIETVYKSDMELWDRVKREWTA